MAKYKKKGLKVDAVRLTGPRIVATPIGVLKGRVGDWLITLPGGKHTIVPQEDFGAEYDPE